MSEDEEPTPVADPWPSDAYVSPDAVGTGPIPLITDDMTAEDAAGAERPTPDPEPLPDPDPGAVTTAFAVVTEQRPEEAETTAFAAVRPMVPADGTAGTATSAGTGASAGTSPSTGTDASATGVVSAAEAVSPSPPRRRTRPALVALAGALVVVSSGIAVAAALAPHRGGGTNAAPVPSAPVSAGPGSTARPDRAFPRYRGAESPALDRFIDPVAGLSYAMLGGRWSLGADDLGLSGALGDGDRARRPRVVMRAGGAEYLSAPLPAAFGRSATAAAAQSLVRKIVRAGRSKGPVLTPYAPERLGGGLRGWLAGAQVASGPAKGETVAVAVVDTGTARPGLLCVTVPKADRAVRPDILALVRTLRVAPRPDTVPSDRIGF